MPARDPRVDAYVAKAPAYAKPILEKLRRVLHSADRTLEEDMKWGAPALMKDGIVCGFMAFKHHVAVWFHKGALLDDPTELLIPGKNVSMRAAHFTAPHEVVRAPIVALTKQAIALNVEGVKKPKRDPLVKLPKELAQALANRPRAKAAFAALPPSHRREHAEWIDEAKRPETRARRLTQTLAKLTLQPRRPSRS